MKTIKIIIASLILVTQSYAFSNNDRNLLLGLTAGTIFAYALHANNTDTTTVHHTKTVYVDSSKDRRIYNKHRHPKRHFSSHHRMNNYDTHRERKHRRFHREEFAYNHGYKRNYRY